ncbi:MAG: riboflavin synthase subunit alpha [Patescibacteria group bacterium]
MFTGIVQGNFTIVSVEDKEQLRTFVVELSKQLAEGLEIGSSVAIDGVCHTVVAIDGFKITFDAMAETLMKTNIRDLKVGDTVNIERSAKMGDEIGGHIMSGHVSTTGIILTVHNFENNHVIAIQVPPQFAKYIFNKGFVGVDGCSLTVTDYDRENSIFCVYLIPETLRVTGFAKKVAGDRVNIELDAQTQTIVESVINFIKDSKEDAIWEKISDWF